mgnify:FL=1
MTIRPTSPPETGLNAETVVASDKARLQYISPQRARAEQLLASGLYKVAVAGVIAFALAPVIVVFLTSLSPSPFLEFPPSGISFRWWNAALTSTWLDPLWFSLRLAVVVSLISTTLGTLAAFAISRGSFRGREMLSTFLLSPLLIPQIVIGVALLQYLSVLHLRSLIGLPALVVGHVVITIPYVLRTVLVSLSGFDIRLEWAARDLGAGPIQTFRYVTLPIVKNGVFAGAVISFIISFNDVPISLFLNRPGQIPIPIRILNYMEYRFDPALAAVAVVTVGIVLILIAIGQRFARVSEYIYHQD